MVVLMDASNAKHRGGPGDPLRNRRSNDRQYVFNATFGADSTQHDVYNKTTEPLIRSVLEGYNATVFAYGATGSGKTYTMVGTPEHPGKYVFSSKIILCIVSYMFTKDVYFQAVWL